MKRPNHIYCISCGCALTTDERTICKHCSPESYYSSENKHKRENCYGQESDENSEIDEVELINSDTKSNIKKLIDLFKF